jgi:nitrite reductase (NADH) large subunit
MKTHIIIGTSAAGYGAATTLNRLDPKAHIICISKEMLSYNKCLLVDYLAQTKDIRLSFAPSLQVLMATEVVSLKVHEKRVVLSSGEQLAYDTLLLAVGAMPKKHPYGNVKGLYSFYTFADVEKIKTYIQTHSSTSAVVIGGGFTGLECASALAYCGIRVSIIEQRKHILPETLSFEAAQHLSSIMSNHSITVIEDDSVEELYTKKGTVTSLRLKSGTLLQVPLIIYAGGSIPSCTLAEQAGLLIQKGIVTNTSMQTSVADIYAAGDCALVRNKLHNNATLSSTWPDAIKQGMVAAHSMAGMTVPYQGVTRSYTSSIAGITITTYGTTSERCESSSNEENHYSFFLDKDERVIGFTSIGTLKKARELRKEVDMHSPIQKIRELIV